MASSQYVMATIHIPIEITFRGEQITHSDLYRIEFSRIDGLPKPSDSPSTVDISALLSSLGESSRPIDDELPTLEVEEVELEDYSGVPSTHYFYENSGDLVEEILPDPLEQWESGREDDREDDREHEHEHEHEREHEDDREHEHEHDREDYEDPTIIFDSGAEFPKKVDSTHSSLWFVSKDEIREKRPYPKSRTFRREPATNWRRKSCKSDSRYIDIPKSVLEQLHPSPE